MDAYYTMLLEQPAVIVSGHHDTGAKISTNTVSRIHKLLKSAFGKAVAWEYTSIIQLSALLCRSVTVKSVPYGQTMKRLRL